MDRGITYVLIFDGLSWVFFYVLKYTNEDPVKHLGWIVMQN